METISSQLAEIEKKYISVYKKIQRKPSKVEGSLVIAKHKNRTQYYHQFKNAKTGKYDRRYIRPKQMELAIQLANQSYRRRLSKLLEKRIKQLKLINKTFQDDEIDQVYLSLSPERQALVDPLLETYSQKLETWKSTPYPMKGFKETDLEIYSKRGERVRSKTEKILADMFFDLGIEYKYECPLYLNNTSLHPDFTLFHPHHHHEIYWEHFGMMDHPEYAVQAVKRIGIYRKNGYFLDERLIATFESSRQNLDYQEVRMLIARFFDV